MGEKSSGRVHFRSEQPEDHCEKVVVTQGQDGESVDVHVGFLQCSHVYNIEVPLQHQLGAGPVLQRSSYVRLVRSSPGAGGIDNCLFEFFAHTEGILLVTVRLLSSQETATQKSLFVRFHAKVLGRLMGSPVLKIGVHSSGLREEEPLQSEDEVSDSDL